MKKALPNTKVTVKLRRSNYKEEWYLIIESYPVYKRGSTRASRVVESINRTISTPVWDKSSIARILPDGTFNYKPKRDFEWNYPMSFNDRPRGLYLCRQCAEVTTA